MSTIAPNTMRPNSIVSAPALDWHLAIRKRLLPAVDLDAGAHAVRPERIVLENLLDLVFVLRLDDPEAAERLVARHLAHRARHEHAILDAIEELEVRFQELVAHLAHVRFVLELHDV